MKIEGKVTDGEAEPESGIARAGTLQVKKASSRDIADFPMNINEQIQNALPYHLGARGYNGRGLLVLSEKICPERALTGCS